MRRDLQLKKLFFKIQIFQTMHILGIGGLFLRCHDRDQTMKWYADTLGITVESWGGSIFPFKNDQPGGYSNLSFFKNETDYLAPSESRFMLNLRVKNLDLLLAELREKGIELVGEPMHDEPFGKFAWIMDPEGNKLELWEQPG